MSKDGADIHGLEAALVDADALMRVLEVMDVATQQDQELTAAYPLIHDLLADRIDRAFEAINPAIGRT
jgi:hypothetical protein